MIASIKTIEAKLSREPGAADDTLTRTTVKLRRIKANATLGHQEETVINQFGHEYINNPRNRKQRKWNMLGFCPKCHMEFRRYRTADAFKKPGMGMSECLCKRCLMHELIDGLKEVVDTDVAKVVYK